MGVFKEVSKIPPTEWEKYPWVWNGKIVKNMKKKLMIGGGEPTEASIPLPNEDKINVLDGKFEESDALIKKVTEIERDWEFDKHI